MNILGVMQAGLFLIMNALLYPVIALLLCLVVAALFILGGFLSEFAFRRGRGPETDQASNRTSGGRDVSGQGVQTNLLKLMEETEVPVRSRILSRA